MRRFDRDGILIEVKRNEPGLDGLRAFRALVLVAPFLLATAACQDS